jgi:hypothetical protein
MLALAADEEQNQTKWGDIPGCRELWQVYRWGKGH